MRTYTVCVIIFTLGYTYGFMLPVIFSSTPLVLGALIVGGGVLGYGAYYLDKHRGQPQQ